MNAAARYSVVDRRGTAHPRRSSVDWPLAAGMAFLFALILLAIYGPLAAPHDLYYSRATIDGQAPPYPPGSDFVFGSDNLGRDRFSWLLIGARGTVVIAFAAAALRIGVGATLGLLAGVGSGVPAVVLRRLALATSSVPATVGTLLAILAFGVSPEQFVIALALLGWAEPFHHVRRQARFELARPYIEAARSTGVDETRLVVRHLLPNLAPALLTLTAFQVSAVLLLIAELALLSFFVGGATLVDFDARGNAVVAPRIPNWASMLATTRPIVSLYGDLAAVLLPGMALLGAVLATNLFGDALALRAQRLDVYRLFSRRSALAIAILGLVIAVTVTAWPSRLASEIAYAKGTDTVAALGLARQLAQLTPRTIGSAEAERAADLLAKRLDGEIVRGVDTSVRVLASELQVGGALTSAGDITVLALDDADVSGPLVYLDSSTIFGATPPEIAGAIVVTQASPTAVGNVLTRIAAARAQAVLLLRGAEPENYPRAAGRYELPTAMVSPAVLANLANVPLTDLRSAPQPELLALQASLRVRTTAVTSPVVDVLAHVVGPADAPAILIAAPYDVAPPGGALWASASSAAVLVASVEHLRREPISLEVIAVATSTDNQDFAGLRLALGTLTDAQRSRLQAVVLIGPVLSEALTVETQTDLGLPSANGRLAARLRDALGIAIRPNAAGDPLRAITRARVNAPPLVVFAEGPDREPTLNAIDGGTRAVLVICAYVPRHLTELR